jgi:hypothetical protein
MDKGGPRTALYTIFHGKEFGMNTKLHVLISRGFAVILAAIFILAGCDSGGGAETVTYQTTSGGKTYTLVITASGGRAAYTPQSGDRYELTVTPDNTRSVGTVTSNTGTTFTLKPSNASSTFTVTVSPGGTDGASGEIAVITGTVILEDGKTLPGSGIVKPGSGSSGGGGGGGNTGNTGNTDNTSDNNEDEDNSIVTYPEPETAGFSFPLPSVAVAEAYLAAISRNAGVDTPVYLPMKMNLGNGVDTFLNLLSVIAEKGKYVGVDLARCYNMPATEFDPDYTVAAGKDRVVSLVLPDAAESIKPGGHDDINHLYFSSFKNFTFLRRVSGSTIKIIGESAFYGCKALTTADFPEALYIGSHSFYGCDALTTVNLPKARDIGEWAFAACGLTTVDFPAVKDTGHAAFYSCIALTTVNLPKAISIGRAAFSVCSTLTTVNLPMAASIGQQAFYACYALTTLDLPAVAYLSLQALDLCPALTTLKLPKLVVVSSHAFSNCGALTTLDLPSVTTIGDEAFLRCEALERVNLPSVTSFGYQPFILTGTGDLTVTLPKDAPDLDTVESNSGISSAKTVTIKRPADSTGYDAAWKEVFKVGFGNEATIDLRFEDL